ncbi:MAG TPA: superinfection immunity protein [Cellvibrio sp.]|nr:superinfection immunity protein [Cellvibrio sp.]
MGISGISIWQLVIMLFMLLIFLPIYFLPTILALHKKHPHKLPIILINVFGGFIGGLGWIVSLVWCFIMPKDKHAPSLAELEKLHKLKEAGALTQEEFDLQKKRALNI